MGVVVRLVTFLVGVIGFAFVGLDTAQEHFGVDAANLLGMLGETPAGIAGSGLGMVSGGLDQLGTILANAQGAEVDPENPGLVQSWGPEGIGAILAALLVMFSTRR